MTIRNKIIILFSLITLTIMIVHISVVFHLTSKNRTQAFYNTLKKEAFSKANLYFLGEIDEQTFQNIYKSNNQIIDEVQIAIYNEQFDLIYHDASDLDFVKENPKMLSQILNKNEIRFLQDDWQVVGLVYFFENKKYIVTATAIDTQGYTNLTFLRNISILATFIALIIIVVIGHFFSKNILQPVNQIIQSANEITANNLHQRIEINKNSKDEIYALSITINQMLERLNDAFSAQNNMVSQISHELRTPLAAMITELELTKLKNSTNMDYSKTIDNILLDSQKLVKLTNSLLDLAKSNLDPSLHIFDKISLDELLVECKSYLLKINPNYHIYLNLQLIGDQIDFWTIHANEYLLKVAFINLIDNACKFSPNKSCEVNLAYINQKRTITFKDEGIGFHKKELNKIFQPFFRGKNATYAPGHGIGLHLTKKIIDRHQMEITIKSSKNIGTEVIISVD